MLIEAGQLKMKKYNIRGQKDMQKKKKNRKKGKWQMFIVKEKKNPSVSKCMKNIVELVVFNSILLCLNFSIMSSGFI